MAAMDPLAKKSWPINPRFMLGIAPILSLMFWWLDTSPFFKTTLSRGQILGCDFANYWVGESSFLAGAGAAIV